MANKEKIYTKNEYDKIIKLCSTSIILLIFVSDIYFFCLCILGNVLLLLSTIFMIYDLQVS